MDRYVPMSVKSDSAAGRSGSCHDLDFDVVRDAFMPAAGLGFKRRFEMVKAI
jgi:hypothetical protein